MTATVPTIPGDMAELLALPSFRRFLFRSIQSAGILGTATNGADGRNLDWIEGRRSLGFDILREADSGQPVPMRSDLSIMTLIAALREEADTPRKPEKKRDRFDELEGKD